MEVEFRTNKLKKQSENYRVAERAYGSQVARRYIERINIIKQTRNLDELKRLPALRCHELKGGRQEQYAVSLTGFCRLIFTIIDETLEVIRIEEVSKHYDD